MYLLPNSSLDFFSYICNFPSNLKNGSLALAKYILGAKTQLSFGLCFDMMKKMM